MKINQGEPDFINGLYDSGRATADMAVEAVGDNPLRFLEVIDISFKEPYPACMRAARVAQLCCEKRPEFILPYLDEIIEKITITNVDGVRRSYLKVISDSVDIKKIAEPGLLVQYCFDWLLSPKEAVSVRYYCIRILNKTCNILPELKSELRAVLVFLIEEGSLSTGLLNHARKVLLKL